MDFQALLAVGVMVTIVLAAVAVYLLLGIRRGISGEVTSSQEARHREMLTDLHDGLVKQGDRIASAQVESSERLRGAVTLELTQTRDRLHSLEHNLSGTMLEKLAEQSRANQTHLQTNLEAVSRQITATLESLTKAVDARLAEIAGKVNERLDEGFKKTNETFISVMTRLQTIDDAQKKIETLTTSVVSLQEVLGDKRSRGAFGEVQLEQIVRNMLPDNVFEFQYTFSNGVRADCVLKLPDPIGLIAVDSKFPLENYERMFAPGPERATSAAFKADVRKHVDDIASKYIIPGVTSDGAVMFLPAEAVFAEIHAHHRDLVEGAARKHVWIVSPTTMMAVLNTIRVVLKDVETRKQGHIIKDALGKLGQEFGRFQTRMDDLARHIGQAKDDVDKIQTTGQKITAHFAKIERVELDPALEHSETRVLPQPPDTSS
jgi:DNA recombination protein RmuC